MLSKAGSTGMQLQQHSQQQRAAARTGALSSTPRPAARAHLPRQHRVVSARSGSEDKNGVADSNKPLTREAEPEEYWKTPAEKEGVKGIVKDPLAIIGIVSILLPFVLLGVAIATGVIDTSVYQ